MAMLNMFTKLKKHIDVPIFTACCGVIPLRKGVIAWGYLNLITTLLDILMAESDMDNIRCYPKPYPKSYAAMHLLFFIVQGANISFSILLVIAGHKKIGMLFECYYYFALAKLLVCTITLTILGVVGMFIYNLWNDYYLYNFWLLWLFSDPVTGVIFIVAQLYFILLVRSELHHMENVNLPTISQNNHYLGLEIKHL